MQTSSVRHVQHHLADILKLVEMGEKIQILRRNQPVAMIVPLEHPPEQSSDWEGHFSEIKKIFRKGKVTGKPMSEIISDARGEY